MNGNGIGAYQRTGVTTADPKKLVLMCYEEAIRNLKIARTKYISRDYEEKARALQKAIAIIEALNCALDFERGEKIAENLHALYNYMIDHLRDSDLKRNIKGMDHIIWMLCELKSAWEEIFNGIPKNSSMNFNGIPDTQERMAHNKETRIVIG